MSGSVDGCEPPSEDNRKQNTIQEKEWALQPTKPWSLVNRMSRQTFLSQVLIFSLKGSEGCGYELDPDE